MSIFTSAQSEIEAFYVGYFGRAADPAGMQYWEAQLNGGMSLTAIAASFAVQAEATTLYPYLAHPLVDDANHDNAIAFIAAVYQDLLGRAPDSVGQAYWLAQLVADNGSPAAVANFIINVISGAAAGSTDDLTLQAKVTVADSFTNEVAALNSPWTPADQAEATLLVTGTTSANVATQEAAGAAFVISGVGNVGQTFSLTTGTDLLPGLIGSLGTTSTAGNDIVVGLNTTATVANWTMNPSDQLNAGPGYNELKLYSGGGFGQVAQGQFPVLTNFQELWINHFGGNTLDVTTNQFPNLSAVQLDNVNGGGAAVTASLVVSHDTLTFSNDSTGGNNYRLSSVADTSENVTFSAVGVTGNHSQLNPAFDNGTQHSAHVTALTIESTGAANFVDFAATASNPLSSITFAHDLLGDTAFSGFNGGSTSGETINASLFTASLTLGTTGAALAVATHFGDSGSGFGDTISLGSGTSYFAENARAAGATGDNITLLAGHTTIDTLDSTATNNADVLYTTAQQNAAMSIITNFNLVGTTFTSGDVLKVGIGTEAVGNNGDINFNSAGDVWANVGTGTGFVTGGSLTQFLTDVSTSGHTNADVIAYTDGHNTYVVSFDHAGGVGAEQVVELVGVSTATALHIGATATGQINIA